MNLDEVIDVIVKAENEGKKVVRLHTGDPSLYGAIREQIEELAKHGIACEVCPGVSSFLAAAAAVQCEYTVPAVSQSVIITRMPGRTPVPDNEDIGRLAKHKTSMVIFLVHPILKNSRKSCMKVHIHQILHVHWCIRQAGRMKNVYGQRLINSQKRQKRGHNKDSSCYGRRFPW